MGRCEDDVGLDDRASTLHQLAVLLDDVVSPQHRHLPGELSVVGLVVFGTLDCEADTSGSSVAAFVIPRLRGLGFRYQFGAATLQVVGALANNTIRLIRISDSENQWAKLFA